MLIFKMEESFSRIPLLIKLIYYDWLGKQGLSYSDMTYGMHKRQYYRVYKGRKEDFPIIFFIHGGGWWHGSPKFSSAIGKFFCKKGYTTVLPAYRLVPYATYPEQIKDVATAFSKFIESEEIKAKKVIVIGFSAGGELGARLVFDRNLHNSYNINPHIFRGFISLSGVLDFATYQSTYAKRLIKNYLARQYKAEKVNPKELIYKVDFPVLCIHGERDQLIHPYNAISFAKRVKEVGSMSYVRLIKHYHHSDIIHLIIGKGKKETYMLLEFIERYSK